MRYSFASKSSCTEEDVVAPEKFTPKYVYAGAAGPPWQGLKYAVMALGGNGHLTSLKYANNGAPEIAPPRPK